MPTPAFGTVLPLLWECSAILGLYHNFRPYELVRLKKSERITNGSSTANSTWHERSPKPPSTRNPRNPIAV